MYASGLPGDVSSPLIRLMLRAGQLPESRWPSLLAAISPDLPALVASPNARIALEQALDLGEWLMTNGRCGTRLGLCMGQEMRDTDLGLPGQIARTAPTLRQALEKFVRFSPLLTRCYLIEPRVLPGSPASLRFQSPTMPGHHRFLSDAVLSISARLVEQLVGRQDAFTHVTCGVGSAWDAQALQEQLGLPLVISPDYSSLLLQAEAMDWPVVSAEPGLHALLCELGEQRLRALQQNDTASGSVRQWLASHLYGGRLPTLEDAAESMGMPAWTLRRRLRAEQVSFRCLLDDMRHQLALEYLADQRLSLGEVAFAVGFSSPSAFQRAFKRWNGQPPGRYRECQA